MENFAPTEDAADVLEAQREADDAGSEPPEAPAKDVWLKQWLMATGEPLANLTGVIVQAVTEREPRNRKRRPADQRRLEQAVELVICNLIYTAFDGKDCRPIAYSRRKALKPTRYDNRLAFTDTFRKAVDSMGALGMLERTTGVVNEATSTFRPTKGFLSEVEAYGIRRDDVGVSQGEETIILKTRLSGFSEDGTAIFEGVGERVDYMDTPKTILRRSEVLAINAFLSQADLTFIADAREPFVDTRERKLRRYFTMGETTTPRFDLGGRLFGGWWQNLRKERRAHIRIDGEPCSVLDYSAMFPRLAYAEVGLQSPLGLSSPGGPWDMYDLNSVWPAFDVQRHRKATKVAFNALLFGARRLSGKTKNGLPKKATMSKVRGFIAAKHPPLTDLFESTIGHILMMKESTILVSVLMRLRDEDIVALPIHDAVVVKTSKVDIVRRAMVECAKEVCGYIIPVSATPLLMI